MWENIVELFSTSQAWIALVMLTLMEIILGIDNILFISIFSNKLPPQEQPKARNIGLLLAMLLRIALLFCITLIVGDPEHPEPLFDVHFWKVTAHPTTQSLILAAGGLFLLYKSVSEIHHKLEGENEHNDDKKGGVSLSAVVIQISLINLVFSVDSILTAVGFTQDLARAGYDTLPVMVLGVIFSVLLMMAFAGPIGRFINKHPSIQMLGLSFLILIGFMLLAEAAHTAHFKIENIADIQAIPKGYLYFAIAFSLFVEFLNIRFRRKSQKAVQLRGALEEAKERDIYDMNPEQ